jgi:hypothetical protein
MVEPCNYPLIRNLDTGLINVLQQAYVGYFIKKKKKI